MKRHFRSRLALAAAFAILPAAAAAHAHLTGSAPADGATVAAPKTISLQLSERLEAKFSGADLQTGGKPVAAKVAVSGTTISVTPAAPLRPGAYTVDWHVLSTDGHKSKGHLAFTVK